jgi:hypothetical protein
MAGNPDMGQHDASYLAHPNTISAQLSSSNVTFNVHKKLLEYDLVSKVRSDSLSREEVGGLIQESEKESRKYDCEIGRLETELERLKTEIERLESILVALRKGQEELDTATEEFRTALCPCPIRKLPTELLSEIFRLAFPNRYPNRVRSDGPSHFKPLILARTCTHWRSIAFGTPSLWSEIRISVSFDYEDDDPRIIACERTITFVLERSRDHPLSLVIHIYHSSLYDYDDPPLLRAMGRLIMESRRWHSMKLRVDLSSLAFNFWGLTLDLPNLCSFALHVRDCERSSIPLCLAAFQNAPMLRKFDLEAESVLDDRIRVVLPWHQLGTIKCPFSPAFSPAMLISYCTNLKSAHLFQNNDGPEGNQSPIPEPLTTSINTLVLEVGSGQFARSEFCRDIERYLRQLQFNSLRSLDIRSRRLNTAFTHIGSFIKLVSEYRSLTSLRLCNVAFCNVNSRSCVDEGTLELLKNLTSLESLEIVERKHEWAKDCILQDLFVQALTVSRVGNHLQQGTPILPVLQHLILEAQGKSLKDRSLVDLVCSRWCPLTSERGADTPVQPGSVTSLSSVRFVLTKRRCDAEVFQPLVDMAAAGLNVTVIDSVGRVV